MALLRPTVLIRDRTDRQTDRLTDWPTYWWSWQHSFLSARYSVGRSTGGQAEIIVFIPPLIDRIYASQPTYLFHCTYLLPYCNYWNYRPIRSDTKPRLLLFRSTSLGHRSSSVSFFTWVRLGTWGSGLAYWWFRLIDREEREREGGIYRSIYNWEDILVEVRGLEDRYNTPQDNTKRNATQRNAIQYNTIQYNTTRPDTTWQWHLSTHRWVLVRGDVVVDHISLPLCHNVD